MTQMTAKSFETAHTRDFNQWNKYNKAYRKLPIGA